LFSASHSAMNCLFSSIVCLFRCLCSCWRLLMSRSSSAWSALALSNCCFFVNSNLSWPLSIDSNFLLLLTVDRPECSNVYLYICFSCIFLFTVSSSISSTLTSFQPCHRKGRPLLLNRQFELEEESERRSSLLAHDLVDQLGIELYFHSPEHLLYLLEIADLGVLVSSMGE